MFEQTSSNARIVVLIPHQFEHGEPAGNRDYELAISYQPNTNYVQDDPVQDLQINNSYTTAAIQDEPDLRRGNHVTMANATRSFKEIIQPGGGGGEMLAYMSEAEYGAPQTISVEVVTPGLFMVLHGPSTHGQSGPEIDRPQAQFASYSGLLLENIDNDREAAAADPTDLPWDWHREIINPAAPENAEDDDFVRANLHFVAHCSLPPLGAHGNVELELPDNMRAFTANGSEITHEHRVVSIVNPGGPLAELVSTGEQSVWIEAGPGFRQELLNLFYQISGIAIGSTGPIRDLAELHSVGLDVSGNKDTDAPEDGRTTFLPGYRGEEAVLHDDEKSFAELSYTGAQELHLVIEGAAHLQAEFSIIGVSKHSGFAVNTPEGTFEEGEEEDYSFDPDENLRHATAEAAGPHLVVPIYCKDYGGYCVVRVILRDQNDKEIGRSQLLLPHVTRQVGIADKWLVAEAERWQALHPEIEIPGDDFAPGDDTEPLEPHETEGDGLTVFEEYRGFILDGGRDENGPHDGGHRRLSAARKELLIDILEMPGINEAGGDPAATVTDFSVAETMGAVAALYNDETEIAEGVTRGCDIDMHWVVRPIDLGEELTLGGFLPRNAYSVEGDIRIGNFEPPVMVTGSGYVHRDLVMRHQGQEGLEAFLTHYSMADLAGSDRDHHKRMRIPELNRFVRLKLVSRWISIYDDPPQLVSPGFVGKAMAIYKHDYPWDEQGARVSISDIREEGVFFAHANHSHYTDAQFNAVIQWVIAHEIGHLIIREQNGTGWNGGHFILPGFVMSHSHPGLDGIDAVRFHDAETAEIDLPGRASVIPPNP